MAYSTGTAASPAALQVIIENFAVTNGFTLTGGSGGWLSKGNSFVSLNPQSIHPPINIKTQAGKILVDFTVDITSYFTVGQSITITGCLEANYNGTYTIDSFYGTTAFYVATGTLPTVTPATGFFTCIITPDTEVLGIRGANSNDGLTTPCRVANLIYVPSAFWPVTYHLFYNGTPDLVVCVLVYDTDKVQTIIFGDIVKVNNSAYVGGNWFFASKGGIRASKARNLISFTDTVCTISDYNHAIAYTGGSTSPIPFLETSLLNASHEVQNFENFHAEIDSMVWASSVPSTYSAWGSVAYARPKVEVTDYTRSCFFRNPNTWNSQSLLVPIHLQAEMASSLWGYIGYVEHLRYFRIGDYNIGDIITISPDSWMVFPWIRKDATFPNGHVTTLGDESSGTLGFAVRYTP